MLEADPAVEIAKAWIGAAGAVGAAGILALIGTLGAATITRQQARRRDRQDRESQWRSHAVELTKLDVSRMIELWKKNPSIKLEPPILSFLAHYRDLSELGERSPGDLYMTIRAKRISTAKKQQVTDNPDNDSGG